MALTVSIDPASYNLVKNKMLSRLTTNRYVVTAPAFAKIVLTFTTTTATVGQSIVFTTIGGLSVSMVFAASLDDSGLKLRTNTTGLTLAQFVVQVFDDLCSNYNLFNNFDIHHNTNSITLDARVSGNDWTTVCFCTATGITVTTNTAGVDQVSASNHRIRVDVYAEDSYGANYYKRIGTMEAEPFNGFAEFDSSDILRYSFSKPDLPDFNEILVIRCTLAYKRYKLTCTEKYGNPAAYKHSLQLGPFFAYFSGVSFQEFDDQPLLLNYFIDQKRFLTWQETEKNAWIDSQDYLFIPIATGVTQFRMKVVSYYSDGTSDTQYPFTRTGTLEGEVYRLPSGYKNLQLIGGVFDPAKTVKYYDVYVDDNGGSPAILFERFRYYMQYRDRYTRQQFIFNNSLPAMETLETTGELVTGIECEAFLAEKADVFTDAIVDEMTFKTYAEKLDVFKVSTGWQSMERIDQVVDEMFLANHILIADRVKEEWIPVVINKSSLEKFRSNTQDLFAVNFEYAYAFSNKVHAGDIEPADVESMEISIPTSDTLVLDDGDELEVE